MTTHTRPVIMPGTHTEGIYHYLLGQMSREGIDVMAHLDDAAQLAAAIQERGHRSDEAVTLAANLGLDPRFLPHKRY